MKKEIPELNYHNFKAFLKGKPVLVDFWAEWCHPCKAQHKMLEEIAFENDELFSVASVNVDDNRVIATQHAVSNIPTLILFENGKEVRRIIGLLSKDVLVSHFKNALTKNKVG